MLVSRKILLAPAQAEPRQSDAPAPVALADLPAPVSDNAAPSDAQKRRRPPCRISLLADRQFLKEFKALKGTTDGAHPVQAGVSAIVSSSSTPTDLPSFITKTPATWRYTTDEAQAHFAFEALEALGPVIALTGWCSAETSERAYAAGKPLLWLRKRIQEALRAALGPIEMLVTIEEEKKAGALRLHVHGVLGLDGTSRRRLVRTRQAVRRALGSWSGAAAQHQIRFTANPDCGWVSYCTKRAWLALPSIRARFACDRPGSPWRLSFDGPVLTMTNGVRALAKELHQKAREAVRAARQRAMLPWEPETAPVIPEPASVASDPHRAVRLAPAQNVQGGRSACALLETRICKSPTFFMFAALVERFRSFTVARPRGPPARTAPSGADVQQQEAAEHAV